MLILKFANLSKNVTEEEEVVLTDMRWRNKVCTVLTAYNYYYYLDWNFSWSEDFAQVLGLSNVIFLRIKIIIVSFSSHFIYQ